MFSLRAIQASGRSLPLMTTTTLRRILCHQTSRASSIAKRTEPSNAAGTTLEKRDIHSVVLPWPSTTPEPEIEVLDVGVLCQVAAKDETKAKVKAGDLQGMVQEQKIQDLQLTIREQSHQLVQQEKDIKQLETLVMQTGFSTIKNIGA